jgi:hypothetical protein
MLTSISQRPFHYATPRNQPYYLSLYWCIFSPISLVASQSLKPIRFDFDSCSHQASCILQYLHKWRAHCQRTKFCMHACSQWASIFWDSMNNLCTMLIGAIWKWELMIQFMRNHLRSLLGQQIRLVGLNWTLLALHSLLAWYKHAISARWLANANHV